MITIFPTLFKLTSPTLIEPTDVIERIRHGSPHTRNIIEELRATTDPVQIKRLKESLPVYLWSGEFNHRSAAGCLAHSGLICLDFDDEVKANVIGNPYVYIAFLSPTGTGVKAIVRIPPIIEQHERHFRALQEYFNLPTLDTGGDLPRSCFDSIDPDIYVNESAPVFIAEEGEEPQPSSSHTYFPVTDEHEIIQRIKTWLDRRKTFATGGRNSYIHSFCAAMNRFGVSRASAESVALSYAGKDFGEREILAVVKSAYGNTAQSGTAVFENVRILNSFKVQKQMGVSDDKLIDEAKRNGLKPVQAQTLIASLESGKTITKFWTVIERPNDRLQIDFNYHLMFMWLSQQGFYRYKLAEDTIILIRKTNNIISLCDRTDIIDAINNYMKRLLPVDPHMNAVLQSFTTKSRQLVHPDQLMFLDYCDPEWIEDRRDEGYFFFQNHAVKVTKKRIEAIEYSELPGCIWSRQILSRPISIDENVECEYEKFISLVSCGNHPPEQHQAQNYFALTSIIGYMLHNYKDKNKSRAIVLTDEAISDFAEGGTGKGVFVQGLREMKRLAFIDGKNFKFDKAFLWQSLSIDTQIVWMDDVKKDFNFDQLFAVLTSGIEIEKKNKNPFFIPYERSPKFIITSNYSIKGDGNSIDRRKHEMEFKQYFNKSHTPEEEFGHILYDDWDSDEWNKFYNFMFDCFQYYLSNGLVAAENKNLSFKKLLHQSCQDWIDWCDINITCTMSKAKADIHNQFVSDNPDYNKVKINTTTKWLEMYCKYKGYQIEHVTENRTRMVRIIV